MRAETDLLALRVEGEQFRELAVAHPPLRALLSTLQHAYAGPSGGTATVRRGITNGAPSVTTLVATPTGQVLVATRVEAQDLLVFKRHDHGSGRKTRLVLFERAAPGQRRVLLLEGDTPVSLRIVGDPTGLEGVLAALYGGSPLGAAQVERFRWTGRVD